MKKPKKKLTAAQRKAKKLRKQQFQTIFLNGKQVRIKRPPMIDGMPADEFIRRNADPLWLHQNGMWEYLPEFSGGGEKAIEGDPKPGGGRGQPDEDTEIPF